MYRNNSLIVLVQIYKEFKYVYIKEFSKYITIVGKDKNMDPENFSSVYKNVTKGLNPDPETLQKINTK